MNKIEKTDIQRIGISSVIKNDKNVRKENIFDGSDETCWTSCEGSPQWILVELKHEFTITGFSIQFQGGFAGQNCHVEFKNKDDVIIEPFHPEDINSVQNFNLKNPVLSSNIKLVFDKSTDFFGRIVVYSLDIYYDKSNFNIS